MRCIQKLHIQHGGRQTGSSYMLASIRNSDAFLTGNSTFPHVHKLLIYLMATHIFLALNVAFSVVISYCYRQPEEPHGSVDFHVRPEVDDVQQAPRFLNKPLWSSYFIVTVDIHN